MPRPEVAQQHGYVHAGVLAMLVDTAGGYAGYTLFPEDASVLTVEFKLNLLRRRRRAPRRRGLRRQAGPHAGDHARRGPRRNGGKRTLVAIMQQTLMVMRGKPERLAASPGETMNNLPSLDFDHGETIDMLRETVQQFAADEIAPRAAAIDRDNLFPPTSGASWATSACSASRSTRTTAAPAIGYLAHIVAMEEISRASASVGLSYGAHSNLCVNQIRRNGSDAQKRRYLPKLVSGEHVGALAMSEPGAGSDVVSMRLRADRRRATATSSTATRCGSPTAPTRTRWSSTRRPTRRPGPAASPRS